MLITSINNDKIKDIVKLKDKKYRDKNNLFFVEGIDLVMEAYKSGVLTNLLILEGENLPFDDIPYSYITIDVMKKISDMESISPYFGVCHKIDNKTVGNKIILLDRVQDPGNIGTIIRSAVAFNFDTVVLGDGCADLYNPKVIRSTKGMLFNIGIIQRNLEDFIHSLDGYTIYGTDVTNGNNIIKENIPLKIALVIGNEGQGISNEIKELCDKFLYIDMSNKCESLNAGVSASILMYEVMKKWNMS